MRVTRVYRFSASHRLHSLQLTESDNAELYGKCNNPYGHGHDYVVHVSVTGPVDETTGRVVDVGALDSYINERVVTPLHHKDMNADIKDFEVIVPTTENLTIAIQRRLLADWRDSFGGVQLERVFIEETPRNTFELRSA
jgi:6-pyruvoyltetrahydropterin/6-carboxytetrahydropterin synthase